jgi:hypothetical protein
MVTFFLCDGPIKLVHCEKKKKQNWEAPHLINKRGEWLGCS